MPAWVHERAKHLLAKNPEMNKSTAFAIASQQAHASGKSPKKWGTSGGKQDAKEKYDKPKKEYTKTPNPGKLDSPKLAYKLQGHTKFQGIPIAIENRKGSVRKGKDSDGSEWRTKMKCPYGYIKGTKGVDNEEVDAYVGPKKDATKAYVVHQHKDTGKGYDEDKVMLGFKNKAEAKKAYLAHYDDPKFLGPISIVAMERFKQLVKAKKKLVKISSFLDEFEKIALENIKGGKADGKPVSEYDPKQIKAGIKVEMEHTNNPAISKEIVRDHLEEFPDYYTRLKKMEDEAKEKKANGGDDDEGKAPSVSDKDKIVNFIDEYPGKLKDKVFHEYLEGKGINPHKGEEVVYDVLKKRAFADEIHKIGEAAGSKASGMNDDSMSPKQRLRSTQKVGRPRTTPAPGKTISATSRPQGFGKTLAGTGNTL
jgi:hypothetical protein